LVFWLAPWSDDVRAGKHVEFQQHFVWVDARRFCTRHYPRTQLTGDVAACRVGAHEILYYTRLPGIVIYRLNVMYRTTYLCRSQSDYNGDCSTQYLHKLCFAFATHWFSQCFQITNLPSVTPDPSNKFLDQRLFFRWPMPCNKSSPNGLPCTGSFATWKRKTSLGDWGASTPNMKACNHDLP